MRASRIVFSALLTVFALAAIPGQALATAKPKLWDVTFTGSGKYSLSSNDGSGNVTSASAAFKWTSTYSTVALGKVFGGIASPKSSKYSGSWQTSVVSNDGTTCTGNGGLKQPTGELAGLQGNKSGSSYRFYITALAVDGFAESPDGANDCSNLSTPKTDFWNDWIVGFSHMGTNYPLAATTTVIKLTKSEQKKKKLVFNAAMNPEEGVPADCNGAPGCGQTYGWTGKITFTRVSKPRA